MASMFSSVALVAVVVSVVLLSTHLSAAAESGTASFYTPPYEPSACFGDEHQDGMTAAANQDVLWHGGHACGKRYKVRCVSGTNEGVARPCKEGKTVTVQIIDLCPSDGCKATIDLSREAFAHIADLDEGIINISFEEA